MPFLQRDGVSLFYEDAQGAAPPLVLVHGLGCDHSYMAQQFDAFSGAHAVVSIDLRGHGQSDKPQQDYTIPGFADDLAWMISALSLDRPVLIGHSMGGAACLELAAEHPELVGGVVVLDTAVMPGPDAWAGIQRVLKTLQTDNYAEELRQFFSTAFFLPGDNTERKARIVEEMVATPKHVLASAFANIFEWDSAVAVARCRVPAVYIGSSRPRGDYAQISKTNPSLVFGQVVGSGHFVQLEVPDQVNSMIQRFLELYMPGPER